MLRVGVDVGGTFTDIFVQDQETGEAWSAKVLTRSICFCGSTVDLNWSYSWIA